MEKTKAEQLKAAYAEALELQKAGKDDAALAKYAEIVEANANIAEVHFQIARIFIKNDRLDRSMPHLKAAAKLKPSVPDIWKLWSEAVMSLSDKGEQRAFLDALKEAPLDKRLKGQLSTAVTFKGKSRFVIGTVPEPRFRAIVEAINAGRHEEAEKLARAELRRHPKVAALHDVLAVSLTAQARYDEALSIIEKAVRMDPDYPESRVDYARVLMKLERAPEGIHQCNVALRLSPGLASALYGRSECFYAMGFKDSGKADLYRTIDADPKMAKAYHALANHCIEEKQIFEARDILDAAKRKGLDDIHLTMTRGAVLSEMGEFEQALAIYRKVIERDPSHAVAHSRIGEMQQTLGQFEAAEETFGKALALDPDRGETYRVSLTSKKIDADDPIVPEMERRFGDEGISSYSRANFGFALAKVMEDNKLYDRVFDYLRPANDLMREHAPYDIERRVEHDHRMMKSFRTVDWTSAEMNEASDFAPIFVTGMPRSGTTLVEQIVASHSAVTGGDELGLAPARALKMFGDEEGRIAPASAIGPEKYRHLADWYEAEVRRLFPGVARITDKSINTFSWIGPLKRAMPKARFVVVRRDPRDNLLSIYKNVFPGTAHGYSYSMRQVAQVYRLFVEYVELWRELTPDWFYEIQYEDLVANPEEEARKLIDACKLDWEDACLEFHKTERRVKTLSVYQVRQPLYKSSTRAWERYKHELGELFDALGPEYMDAAE